MDGSSPPDDVIRVLGLDPVALGISGSFGHCFAHGSFKGFRCPACAGGTTDPAGDVVGVEHVLEVIAEVVEIALRYVPEERRDAFLDEILVLTRRD